MDTFIIAFGITSILLGLLVRFHPRLQPKPIEYVSNKARRVALLDQKIHGIANIILGVSFIGIELTSDSGWEWVFILLLAGSAAWYLIKRAWITHSTARETSDYEI